MAVVIDTCVVIGFLRGSEPDKTCFVKLLKSSEGLLTAVTVFELLVGSERDSKKQKAVTQLLGFLGVLPFDKEAAGIAAVIGKKLREQGSVIGTRDIFIAGICLAHKLPIVTGNREHFARVPGLKVLSPAALASSQRG